MESLPLVSILIPVYNRELLIKAALESALQQTYPNIEIVVVDNCSTDHTFDVVQMYAKHDKRVRCWRNDENVGAIRNWIKCLDYSHGEYIKILFSDDWLEPDAVQSLLLPLQKHNDVGFSYSSVTTHFEDTGHVILTYSQKRPRVMDRAEFLRAVLTDRPPVPVSPGCALFRRKDVERGLEYPIPDHFGLQCNEKGIGSDLLIFLRTCDSYPHVYYIDRPLSHFRGHRGSISLSHSRQFNSLCYDIAFGWFLATSNLPADQKQTLNGFLLSRSLNPSRFKIANTLNPWEIYKSLFPKDYLYVSFRWRHVIEGIWFKIRNRLNLG